MATNGKKRKQEKHRSRPVTLAQFIVVILITIALAVVLDFGHRAAISAELKREAQELEREVATLEAEHRALEMRQERVQTDGYVEEWARTEGSMVLRGETPVVPVPTGQLLPVEATPAPSPAEAEKRSGHWQEWWALFFGADEGK